MARKQNNYWKKRFETIEAASNAYGQDVYRQIEPAFTQAQREIQAAIDTWYTRIAVNNQVSITEARKLLSAKELAEFKWDVKEFIKYGEDNALDPIWMKQLENASAKYHISRLEALKIQTQQSMEKAFGNELDDIDAMARRIYTDDYYHSAYEIQSGLNVGWDVSKVDVRRLEKLISKPWAADGKNFSDRIWQSKTSMVNELHNELVRTCILGKSPDEAIRHMTKFVDKKFSNAKMQAGRLVMTEQAFFASAAQQDCFNELDVEEFEVVATLDSHTSAICQEMDGKHFPMKDYQPGVTAPPFHVWCRSTTVPFFDDEWSTGERAARGEDGKTYYVPESMKYDDWKKSFVDGGSKDGLKPTTGSATIRNKTPFSPASTIKEAEEFARNTLGIQNVSYKGVDVVTANAWNEGLQDSFDRFPELKQNFGFVGEAHERNTMLKPIAKQHYLDELIKRNPSFSLTQLEPYADKKVRSLMKSVQVGKSTYAQSWSPTAAPFSAFRGVSVNKEWGKKSAEFIESLLDDVKGKFHPVGCDTIRSVLDHEIGHQLDDLLGIKNMDEIQNLFNSRSHDELTDALSRYAWKNDNKNRYSEMIAEAWSEYCNNPQPREIAKTIGETIEAEYNKKFGIK